MPGDKTGKNLSFPNDRDELEKVAARVASGLLADRLLAAGFPLEKVNQISTQVDSCR
jgi:hypothetical protein